MIALAVGHFWSMVWFALLLSIAFALLGKRTPGQRARFAAWTLVKFLLAAILLGWLLYPFSQ